MYLAILAQSLETDSPYVKVKHVADEPSLPRQLMLAADFAHETGGTLHMYATSPVLRDGHEMIKEAIRKADPRPSR